MLNTNGFTDSCFVGSGIAGGAAAAASSLDLIRTMGSRGGGGGNNGGGVQGIPAASRKMVQSLKEIVNGVSEAEIYSALKDCNMDPNEAVNRLLSQGEKEIAFRAFEFLISCFICYDDNL